MYNNDVDISVERSRCLLIGKGFDKTVLQCIYIKIKNYFVLRSC